jgi:hypothetical protein
VVCVAYVLLVCLVVIVVRRPGVQASRGTVGSRQAPTPSRLQAGSSQTRIWLPVASKRIPRMFAFMCSSCAEINNINGLGENVMFVGMGSGLYFVCICRECLFLICVLYDVFVGFCVFHFAFLHLSDLW